MENNKVEDHVEQCLRRHAILMILLTENLCGQDLKRLSTLADILDGAEEGLLLWILDAPPRWMGDCRART